MDQIQAGATGTGVFGGDGVAVLRSRYTTMLFLRIAFLAAVLILAGVGFLINWQRQDSMPDISGLSPVIMVFAVFSILCALAAIFLVPILVPLSRPTASAPMAPGALPSADSGVAGRLFTRAILSGALAESIGLLGFVLLILGVSTQTYLFFLGLSLVSSAVTFPRWSQWEQAYIDDASNVVFG